MNWLIILFYIILKLKTIRIHSRQISEVVQARGLRHSTGSERQFLNAISGTVWEGNKRRGRFPNGLPQWIRKKGRNSARFHINRCTGSSFPPSSSLPHPPRRHKAEGGRKAGCIPEEMERERGKQFLFVGGFRAWELFMLLKIPFPRPELNIILLFSVSILPGGRRSVRSSTESDILYPLLSPL